MEIDVILTLLGITFTAIYGYFLSKYIRARKVDKAYREKYIDNIHDDFDFNDYKDKYNIYIQPYISKHPSVNGNPNNVQIEGAQLLRDYFINKVFIKRTDEPHVFCLLGDTGTGKTAALVHLYHDYINSHTPNNLPYDIKFVSLRRNNAFQTIEEIEEKRKCILLLDAVDENQMAQEPKESEKYKSFIQQLEKAYENLAFVVTTCRPQFFANENEEFNTTKIPTTNSWLKVTKLYLLPFNNEQISEYLDKLFSFRSDNELRHKAEELIDKYPLITRRPLVLTYIREIVESNRNIKTAIDLYDAIVNNSIRRDLNKISPQINNKDISSWWNVLSEVASYLYSHKKNILTSKELQSIISKSTNTNDIIKNYFQQRSLLTRTGNEFHFSHKSFYEYFMAYRFFLYPEEINQVYGMDFALQLFDELCEAYFNLRQVLFVDLISIASENVASALSNIGLGLHNINHFTTAEPKYKRALTIYRQLAKDKPNDFQPYVANTMNKLANLHYSTNRLQEAEEEYNEALTIYNQLAHKNPDAYLPDVAVTLNNLAVLYYVINRHQNAEKEYNEALTIYHQLAVKNPDTYLPDVAMTLNNLANLHSDTNRLHEAEAEFNEALNIRRQLADKNPKAYLPDIAMTLNNLANLHGDTNRHQEAEAEYNEALTIYRQLATQNPDAYLPDVAMTLNNLALLHAKTNRHQEAEAEYNEALTIRRQLADKNPDAYLPYVAKTLSNLARLHNNPNQNDKAETEYKEALINSKIAKESSYNYQTNVVNTINDTANQHGDTRLKEAEEEYNEALTICRQLAEKYPDAFLPDVAMTLFNIAWLRLDQGNLTAAEEAAQESLEKYRIMAEKSHAAFDNDVKDAEDLLERIQRMKDATK